MAFPTSYSLDQIPEVFSLLLPDIVSILQENIDQFCQANETLALFATQLCEGVLTSSFPKKHHRIIHRTIPEYHFCCTLDFLIVQPEQQAAITDWRGFRSVIVDFTRGLVMDAAQYLHELFPETMPKGQVLGEIDSQKMAYVWAIIRGEQYSITSGRAA